MPRLSVHYADGRVETIELSRTSPISIGSLEFNDVCIPETDVSSMHCRIAWNKTGYEAVAAAAEGVEINSKLVDCQMLKSGDLIRIGSVDIHYEAVAAPPVVVKTPLKRDGGQKAEEKAVDPNELSLFSGELIEESYGELNAVPNTESSLNDWDPAILERRKQKARDAEANSPVARLQQMVKPTLGERLAGKLGAAAARPGERDVTRSPLVLGLTGFGALLLLLSGIIWFFISRESAQRLYDQGISEFEAGRYAQAIEVLEDFMRKHSHHSRVETAEITRDRARIQRELSGAAPAFARGVEELEKFIATHRDRSYFHDLHTDVRRYAEQIGIGAANAAESARDPEFLTLSEKGAQLLDRYADPKNPPVAAQDRIRLAQLKATTAIQKQRAFDQAIQVMEKAIAERDPVSALAERRRLVLRYPDLVPQKRLQDCMQQAMGLERAVIKVDDSDKPAEKGEPANRLDAKVKSTALLALTRSRSDEPSQGRIVFTTTHDAVLAIDSVTGEPLWKRVVGAGSPFFPQRYVGRETMTLVFDTRHRELLSLKLATGQVVWRQAFPKGVRAPLLMDGRWLVPVLDGSICRIDAETGTITARVQLSQSTLGPPVRLGSSNQFVVPGEAALIYGLSLQPFAVTAMTFTGHAREAVHAPLLAMGNLLLLCDNDRPDRAQLRVFECRNVDQPFPETATISIPGVIRDSPVLRGSQLVVPIVGHRLMAFTVTDDPGQPPLTRSGDYQIPDPYSGPQQIALGPENRFWIQSSLFRRFELKPDGIRLDEAATAPGFAAQPLQLVEDQYYLGRRSAIGRAITFSPADRESMTVPWRIVSGAGILSLTAGANDGLLAVTDQGNVFSIASEKLSAGGLETRATLDLEIPLQLSVPLQAAPLPDDRVAVWCDGDEPMVWVLNKTGTLESQRKLTKGLQVPPLPLRQGFVQGSPGRLLWQPASGAGTMTAVQDWIAPLDQQPGWKWIALLPVSESEFVAISATGVILRMQFREQPVPHLAEAGRMELPAPVDLPVVRMGNLIVIVDAEGSMHVVENQTLDLRYRRPLGGGMPRNLWPCGESVLVHFAGGKLALVKLDTNLPVVWERKLEALEPVGQPFLHGESVWVADREGQLQRLLLSNGETKETRAVPQRLAAMKVIGERCWLVAMDGTLFPFEEAK